MNSLLHLRPAARRTFAGGADFPFRTWLSIHSARIELRSSSADWIRYLTRLYGRFACDGPLAGARTMLLAEDGSPEHAALSASLRPGRGPVRGHLVAVEWLPYALAIEYADLVRYYAAKLIRYQSLALLAAEHMILHGAALTDGEAGILLVGEAASGKTSLALRMSRAGFLCASDDTALIRRSDGACLPYPIAFFVRSPLPGMDAGAPDVRIADERRWVAEPCAYASAPFVPTHLVFVAATGADPARLVDVAPAEAVVEVLRNVVRPLPVGGSLPREPEDDLDAAADLAGRTACLRLDTQDLDAAQEALMAVCLGARCTP